MREIVIRVSPKKRGQDSHGAFYVLHPKGNTMKRIGVDSEGEPYSWTPAQNYRKVFIPLTTDPAVYKQMMAEVWTRALTKFLKSTPAYKKTGKFPCIITPREVKEQFEVHIRKKGGTENNFRVRVDGKYQRVSG